MAMLAFNINSALVMMARDVFASRTQNTVGLMAEWPHVLNHLLESQWHQRRRYRHRRRRWCCRAPLPCRL